MSQTIHKTTKPEKVCQSRLALSQGKASFQRGLQCPVNQVSQQDDSEQSVSPRTQINSFVKLRDIIACSFENKQCLAQSQKGGLD